MHKDSQHHRKALSIIPSGSEIVSIVFEDPKETPGITRRGYHRMIVSYKFKGKILKASISAKIGTFYKDNLK